MDSLEKSSSKANNIHTSKIKDFSKMGIKEMANASNTQLLSIPTTWQRIVKLCRKRMLIF